MWRTSLCLAVLGAATLGTAVPLAVETTSEPGPVIPAANTTDVCHMGPMKGGALIECEAYIPMYTFNMERGSCEGFIYGGCGGSNNLFDTRAECEQRCGHHSRVARDAEQTPSCLQLPESGRCLALFTRFAFNKETGECEQFTYGGCGGNDNNFKTESECYAKCKPDRKDRQLDQITIDDSLPVVEEN